MLGSTSSGGKPSGRSRIGTETSLETSFENPPTCIDRSSSFEEELFRGLEEEEEEEEEDEENGKKKKNRVGKENNNSSSQVRGDYTDWQIRNVFND